MKLIDITRDNWIPVISMTTNTDPANARGIHLYTQFGFVPTGEIWDGDEVVYCLTLS